MARFIWPTLGFIILVGFAVIFPRLIFFVAILYGYVAARAFLELLNYIRKL
jgi:hypothetical protein